METQALCIRANFTDVFFILTRAADSGAAEAMAGSTACVNLVIEGDIPSGKEGGR